MFPFKIQVTCGPSFFTAITICFDLRLTLTSNLVLYSNIGLLILTSVINDDALQQVHSVRLAFSSVFGFNNLSPQSWLRRPPRRV